jgi:hypothetical protein
MSSEILIEFYIPHVWLFFLYCIYKIYQTISKIDILF